MLEIRQTRDGALKLRAVFFQFLKSHSQDALPMAVILLQDGQARNGLNRICWRNGTDATLKPKPARSTNDHGQGDSFKMLRSCLHLCLIHECPREAEHPTQHRPTEHSIAYPQWDEIAMASVVRHCGWSAVRKQKTPREDPTGHHEPHRGSVGIAASIPCNDGNGTEDGQRSECCPCRPKNLPHSLIGRRVVISTMQCGSATWCRCVNLDRASVEINRRWNWLVHLSTLLRPRPHSSSDRASHPSARNAFGSS